MTTYVLDSFALLAMFRAEPGAPRVREILSRGDVHQFFIASVNLGEVFYKTVRQRGAERARVNLRECRDLPMTVVPVDEDLAISAAIIKGTIPISYADCIAAALTQRMGATLVTGDRDFEKIRDLDIEWLAQ